MFITQFKEGATFAKFIKILPTALPLKRTFSNIISELSPNFCEIYNQAYIAEQTNLMQICGTGYRKSLEFLIKDYLISITPEDQHETIRNKFLNNCIRDNISNINIKQWHHVLYGSAMMKHIIPVNGKIKILMT